MATQNSVVVVNFNGREKLERMLAALKMQEAVTSEVIVVDNSSFDGSAEMVESEFAGVRVERMKVNRGFATAAAAGVEQAKGDVVVICHADLLVTMHNLTELADQLREARGRRAAAMLPRLVDSDGNEQPFVARLPKLATGVVGAFGPRLARRGVVPALDHVADHEYASFACCAFDCDVLASLGSLDRGFFLYFEDADLCARMHDRGHRLLISRNVKAVHTGAGLGAPIPPHLMRVARKDLTRFFKKQRPAWEQAVVGWADSTRKLVTRQEE